MSSDLAGRLRIDRGRLRALAVNALLAIAVLLVELTPYLGDGPRAGEGLPGSEALRLAAFTLPLLFLRRFPVVVLAVMILAFHGSGLLGPGLVVAFYGVGAWTDPVWRSRTAAVVGATAVTASMVALRNVALPTEAILTAAVFGGAWLLGDLSRVRRHYAEALEERARRLEVERDERSRRAVLEERARITRDLHDIVAHRLSMMTIQAGAARVVADTDPDAAQRALGLLEDSGRQTLAELRQLMGVLHADDEPHDLAPSPTLACIDQLAREMQDAGVPVRVTVLGELAGLPEAVDVNAYRIVQEALTNVVKHAGPGAEVDVIVQRNPDVVELEIMDTGRGGAVAGDGLGHGIAGMRERASFFGGRVEAGPRPEAGFAVRATIPSRDPGA
jgi:signal transduction histidine kinase